MNKLKNLADYIGISRLVVIGFLLLLMISVFPLGINPGMIYSDCLVRVGMNGFLVLAMMISIVCGAGLNFGLPIGILCGLFGGSIAVQFNWSGLGGMPCIGTGCYCCRIPVRSSFEQCKRLRDDRRQLHGIFHCIPDVHRMAGTSLQQPENCMANHRCRTSYNHDTGREL